MDRRTIAIYQDGAGAYAARRTVVDPERAAAFATRVPAGGVRLDLGCGPGLHLPLLGRPAMAADAAPAMVAAARARVPGTPGVVCDLAALPVRRGALAGVWASKCLQHVPRGDVPLTLAGLHRALAVGGVLDLTVFRHDADDGRSPATSDFPGRWFTWWEEQPLADLLVGAGFDVEEMAARTRPVPGSAAGARGGAAARRFTRLEARAVRARTLPDTVAPGMRLLMCGLNPSLYAADAGIGFARPGNRYWPAVLAAGLATVDRSPDKALRDHGIGMTDIVKRATTAAAELTAAEYRTGLARVARLVAWLRPGAVCFVGLAGWRVAVDRHAVAGVQPVGLGGVPVYVMPSTSGLNARSQLAELTDHLRRAAALADGRG
jgi:double-stranded uracil-DNA glycosylase